MSASATMLTIVNMNCSMCLITSLFRECCSLAGGVVRFNCDPEFCILTLLSLAKFKLPKPFIKPDSGLRGSGAFVLFPFLSVMLRTASKLSRSSLRLLSLSSELQYVVQVFTLTGVLLDTISRENVVFWISFHILHSNRSFQIIINIILIFLINLFSNSSCFLL